MPAKVTDQPDDRATSFPNRCSRLAANSVGASWGGSVRLQVGAEIWGVQESEGLVPINEKAG